MKVPTHYQGVPIPTNPKRGRNVTLSCAECRRLKLKCSRVFPCANCVKKGCEAICPEGSLTTGKGNRFVLANTEFLHEKINALSSRVRQLEDALEQSHANLSTEPHPLLTSELRALKRPIEKGHENEALSALRNSGLGGTDGISELSDAELNELPDAVGSLSMNQSGGMNFFGVSANAIYLLKNEDDEEQEEEEEEDEGSVLEYIPWLSYAFPFAPSVNHVSQHLRDEIQASMPDAREAEELAAFYFQYAAWMYTPIIEQDFKEQIFSPFYENNATAGQEPIDAHKLALLFFVFAMGKLTDPRTRDLSTQEAMKFFHVGKAALTLSQSLETPSVTLLQGLLVMCHFMFWADIETSRWLTMGIIAKLSQSIGLHRDGAKFGLNPEDTQRHRSLMWEIYTYDSWLSLTFGRPSSFPLSSIDCEMAYETSHNEAGELEMSFHAWKHRFSSQCLSVVHEQAFGARTPNYKIIQELDKKVRGFYIPPSLQVPGFSGKPATTSLIAPSGIEVPTLQLTMQRYTTWAIKEITIFYMHRGYFARSLEENKEDPLGGRYGPSVLAAHSTACSFINLIKSLHSQQPLMAERTWFFLTHVFSCSIVLGAIVTKCPSMGLSRSALSNLESSYALFKSVSHNPRVAKVLPILGRLVKRAVASMEEYQPKKSLLPRLTVENVVTKEDEEALSSALGGTTRFIPRKQGSNSGSRNGTSETDSLAPSSPRAPSPGMSMVGTPPPRSMDSPTPTTIQSMSPVESTRTEWPHSWGQVSQNVGQLYSMYPNPANPTNSQWSTAMDANAANWYNTQQIQFPDPISPPLHPQHSQPHHQQPQYLSVDVTMGNTFPSFGQTSSVLSGAMSPFDYPPQQVPPPENNVQAHWQNLYAEMGAGNYS